MALEAAFAKMNGLGNAIIVADMRGRADRVTPEAALALNADPATRFDQIMAITSGSGSKVRTPDCEVTNTEGVKWGAYQFGYAVLEVDTSMMKLYFKNINGIELYCWEKTKGSDTGSICKE